MRKILFLILFFSIVSSSFAINGLLIKTIDYSFKEKWENTLGESIPKLSTCDTVYKKQYFYLTAIASDYKLDINDIANVEYSIKISKPDNSVYFKQENLPLTKKKISNKHYLQMSDAILKVCFENNDAFGVYKIQIEIIDKIDNSTKNIESEIVLTELPHYDHFKINNDDFIKWISHYYKRREPEKALLYYLHFVQSSHLGKDVSYYLVISSFLEIANNNNYLLTQIIDCYKTQDLKTKIFLLYLLGYSNISANDFYNSLEGEEKDTYLKIKESPLPDIYGTINRLTHLDMLWGTFLVNGSYKPVLKLIKTLDFAIYQGEFDKFKKSKQKNGDDSKSQGQLDKYIDSSYSKEDRQKALNNSIYDSLVGLIKSNCEQHELFLSYCRWALQYEDLSDIQRNELKKIIVELKKH